jgi:hypothetical protein
MKTILSIICLSLVLVITGCSTPEERRAWREAEERREAAMTPLDRCMRDVNHNWDLRACNLQAMGHPQRHEQANAQQQCLNYRITLENQCYARHKK